MNKGDGDIQDEMREETVRDGIMSELHREEEFAAERLASAIESAERGHPLDRRDREDAELAPLVAAAALLRRTWNAVTPDPAYFSRSRAAVLASMRPPQAAGEAPLSWIERLRQSPFFAPVASAAAAGLAAVFITLQLAGGGDATVSPDPVSYAVTVTIDTQIIPVAIPNDSLTAELTGPPPPQVPLRTIENETVRLARAFEQVLELSRRGEPLDATLLRTITDSATFVTNQIENDPGSVDGVTVLNLTRPVSGGLNVLNTASAQLGAEGALTVAQLAAQETVLVAARWFAANPAQLQAATGR